jgi:hypothetical protein
MDGGLLRNIERALADARNSSAAAVVLDLDIRGGDVAMAQLAVGSIIESELPVYAIINDKAWSAGALVALAADSVFMTNGAAFGWGDLGEDDADLAPAAFRELLSEFEVLALRKGLDEQVAIAMVNPDLAIEGLVDAGDRLTLSTADALRLGFADGEVDDAYQLLGLLGLDEAELDTYTPAQLASGITISVTNHNWRDVRIILIYGTSGNIRQRLGNVTSMRTVDFEIPHNMVAAGSRVRALAEVIGSPERASTEQLTAQTGLAIEWTIANVISQSNYFAYIKY